VRLNDSKGTAARPYKLMARLINPLIAPMVRRAVEKDLDALKDAANGPEWRRLASPQRTSSVMGTFPAKA
jgi:hypothetical protein